ncbi:MAG: pyridoxamine 5'-phosphate oxidase [Candidatus Poriferisodalaceae bacterium]|jgi:pyridoxamine 5'-phosphate oxidase
MIDLSEARRNLMAAGLDVATSPADPFELFNQWLGYAAELSFHNHNAMAVATADATGQPSVRNVLYRGEQDGGLSFYTNYESRKGLDLAANHLAEALFSWLEIERQIRFSGEVHRLTAEQSDVYFDQRARDSRIAAIASPQSQKIDGRDDLVVRHQTIADELGDADPVRPDHWGGFALVPTRIEFWQGREHRLHDRVIYERAGDGWALSRIAP